MMRTSSSSLNAYDPVCAVNSCLNQVIGSLRNDPLVQYASCTSLYGSPVVSTVTLAADVALETTTSTLSYTDIIIEVSTTESTAIDTSTSYLSLFETETAYTATVTRTDTVIATTLWNAPSVQKRHAPSKLRRRGCKPRSSTAFMASSTQVSSGMPSSSAMTASSSVPSSSQTCTDSAQLYSACSCINAVSTVSLVTEFASATTSTVHETISTTLTSTSTSVVAVAITTVIVQPMTTTLVSTLTTGTTTTTTTTTTQVNIAPTQTAQGTFEGGGYNGWHMLVDGNGAVGYNARLGTTIAWIVDGGSPYLIWNPKMTLWLRGSDSEARALYFQTAEQAQDNNDGVAFSCSIDRGTGAVSCLAGNGFGILTMCFGYLYMAVPGWNAHLGCVGVTIMVTPWVG